MPKPALLPRLCACGCGKELPRSTRRKSCPESNPGGDANGSHQAAKLAAIRRLLSANREVAS